WASPMMCRYSKGLNVDSWSPERYGELGRAEGRDGGIGAGGHGDLAARHRFVDRAVERFAAQQVAPADGRGRRHLPAGPGGLGGPLNAGVRGAVLRDGYACVTGATGERLQFPDPFLG